MKTSDEIMGLVKLYGAARHDAGFAQAMKGHCPRVRELEIDAGKSLREIRAALTALASGECSVAGLADDLRLVAQLESKRMGAMSSGLLKGVIDRLSALPPPPAEGSQS